MTTGSIASKNKQVPASECIRYQTARTANGIDYSTIKQSEPIKSDQSTAQSTASVNKATICHTSASTLKVFKRNSMPTGQYGCRYDITLILTLHSFSPQHNITQSDTNFSNPKDSLRFPMILMTGQQVERRCISSQGNIMSCCAEHFSPVKILLQQIKFF